MNTQICLRLAGLLAFLASASAVADLVTFNVDKALGTPRQEGPNMLVGASVYASSSIPLPHFLSAGIGVTAQCQFSNLNLTSENMDIGQGVGVVGAIATTTASYTIPWPPNGPIRGCDWCVMSWKGLVSLSTSQFTIGYLGSSIQFNTALAVPPKSGSEVYQVCRGANCE